MIYYLQK